MFPQENRIFNSYMLVMNPLEQLVADLEQDRSARGLDHLILSIILVVLSH